MDAIPPPSEFARPSSAGGFVRDTASLNRQHAPAHHRHPSDGSVTSALTGWFTSTGTQMMTLFTSIPAVGNTLSSSGDGQQQQQQPLSGMVTRPPNVPPKDPDEDARHKMQFMSMLSNSRKKDEERSRAEKEKEDTAWECKKREHEALKTWGRIEHEVLRNWEKKKSSKKLRELCWQGLPPKLRAIIWPKAIGNVLNMSQELFQIHLQQAVRTFEMKAEGRKSIGREGTVALIELDLSRTFPAIALFQRDGPLHDQLRQVLEAYVCYRPDIGYVQGMSYLAAMLLINVDSYEAFQCLANLLNRPMLLGFFRMDMSVIERFVEVLEGLIAMHLSKLSAYLKAYDITPHVYVMDWILTLFTKSLPLDVASRVWDNFLMEDETFLLRVCLGLLRTYRHRIRSSTYDEVLTLLTHIPEDLSETELFENIGAISLDMKCRPMEVFVKQLLCR
eukprot:TRINITY_DN10931_c0_g1_i1.p1 TRINITY_DN10931_c0_g1~~TRINITY_DN10931_c0_g1_i1.p1  ORF type:complete len:456 (+),score=101.64 TRINITY_DN10931_c0_g1_i1:30-1370(+)